jgi:hypothetical protein
MTGFIVPNANQFGVSIQSLDQAEPDSLDFEIVGNNRYAVLSGLSASFLAASNGSAIVAGGEVIIDGVYGAVSGTTLTFTAPSADPRFDLIVAQNNAGTFSLNTVIGTANATNPVFPAVASTQIVLYALYRKSGETFGNNSVVDKRKLTSTVIRSGTGVPPAVGVDGDLYIRTGFTPALGQSSLYVKHSGSWQNLGVYTVIPDVPLNPFLLVGL